LALLGFAPEASFLLAFDPSVVAEDGCLAPDFSGCAGMPPSRDSRATASAALLPWEVPEPEPEPLLAFDDTVLLEGTEVTYSAGAV
jgi:hypothetical protein